MSDTRQMNVLQFICSTGFYGAERWVLAIVNHFDKAQVNSSLLVTSENPNQEIEIVNRFPSDLPAIRIEMRNRFDFSAVKKIADYLVTNKIDVIHTHGYKSDILGLLAARKAGIPCVSTPHGFGEINDAKLRLYKNIGCFSLRYFNAVAPLSQQLTAEIKALKIPEHKIVYIPNGVDISEIDRHIESDAPGNEDKHATPAVAAEPPTIGYIGRLAHGKAIHNMLNIFDSIWQSNPTYELKLIGDGPLRQSLETQAKSLDSRKNIHFLGFRHDRIELMKKFDLFLMTSVSEGIPRSLMEAMALNIPIAAYDIPGINELLTHNDTALLAPLNDTDKLSEHCKMLLNDNELAARLTESARNHLTKTHSAESMAHSYQSLYRKLLKAE